MYQTGKLAAVILMLTSSSFSNIASVLKAIKRQSFVCKNGFCDTSRRLRVYRPVHMVISNVEQVAVGIL